MSVVISGFPEIGKASSYLLLVPDVKVLIGINLRETSNDWLHFLFLINN
jgi:hypothetical protein